ncbi:MAG: hypothetical protein JWM62_2999 [Frankiales bacterium]|jgi:hypothetical protein|nr:hypothetical protein [Frankiales bacterium]
MRISHVPLRLTTGAFILNSGLAKRGLDAESAAGMQGMATAVVPKVGNMPPEQFGKLLSTGEMALGAALLLPIVSPLKAGLALTAFSSGLLQMYRKTPGMTEADGIRPTQAGTGIAKDVWMLGAGLALVLDALIDDTKGAAKSTKKSLKKQAKAAKKALPVG